MSEPGYCLRSGFQRLDVTPVILQVPDFGNRFFTYQVTDARTDAFAQIGKQYGTKPGFYLIVGPNWNGEIPKGVNQVFRSSTDFPRAFQDDTPEDKAAIQPLLSQIMVYPLSEFDGKMKTKDWKSTRVSLAVRWQRGNAMGRSRKVLR